VKICFIGDPRSIHTQRWVRWFQDDHEVSLIATASDDALADVCIATLPIAARPGMRLLAAVTAVRRIVRALRPDVVHGHFINEAGWFAAGSGGPAVVITAWGSDLYRAPHDSRLARRLNPWAVRAADHVTCDSSDQARVLRSWGVSADRVDVVGWGVDRHEFHPGIDRGTVRRRLGIPSNASVVLSPRQWLPNSSIDAIVAAHALLADDVYLILKRIPRFEGSVNEIHAAIEASPARDRIRVVREIEPSELPALYADSDVVVSLCATDGTPVSVLEAMAVGKPIVARQNASVSDWISDPGGCLVADPEPIVVAEAIRGLIGDADARGRAAAHNVDVVAARADRATEMARMEEIYARVGKQGTARGH
jgi:glycosyltransferase involved in cell wall biosynthesis